MRGCEKSDAVWWARRPSCSWLFGHPRAKAALGAREHFPGASSRGRRCERFPKAFLQPGRLHNAAALLLIIASIGRLVLRGPPDSLALSGEEDDVMAAASFLAFLLALRSPNACVFICARVGSPFSST